MSAIKKLSVVFVFLIISLSQIHFYMSEEAQEGKKAYLEKRKPEFNKFPKLP